MNNQTTAIQHSRIIPNIDFSIVIPVYYNEGELTNTFNQVKEKVVDVQEKLGRVGEIIFVDDGSGDGSWDELVGLQKANPKLISLYRFTRNFGHYMSRIAGHKRANGKAILCISADLQDPPELMNDMLDAYFVEGYDIALGERAGRDESWYRKFTSRLYYGLIRKFTFEDMPKGGFDYFLMSHRVRDDLFDHIELNSYFQGQLFWTGYKRKSFPYKRMARESGLPSRWTFKKKFNQTINVILGFSYTPIRLMSACGFLFAGFGFLYALWVFARGIFGFTPNGFAPIMIILLLIGGIQMIMIGIVGEYVWRTLDEVRGRRPYIISEEVEKTS